MEFLKSLDLSLWWRAMIAVGLVLAGAALAVKDRDVLILGCGLIACGFGEWINHPKVGMIEFGMLKSWYERRPNILGLLLDAIGIGLVCYGLYRVLTS